VFGGHHDVLESEAEPAGQVDARFDGVGVAGVEEHEDPYIVTGNRRPLVAGNAYSVEPGIYLPGRFGFRLEDIVVTTEHGPDALNRADHRLVPVDA
jgi:Xaa-Pro aminopeptidase